MASRDKAYEAVEKLAQSTRGSYETVIDHTVALGEQNARFARGIVDTTVREYRQQAEANLAVTQKLIEQAEKQYEAFRVVAKESLDVFWNVLHVPLSSYKEGLRRTTSVGDTNGGLPIANYDDLTVNEVSDRLADLSDKEIERVRVYEKRHKNRETLLAQIDHRAKAAS